MTDSKHPEDGPVERARAGIEAMGYSHIISVEEGTLYDVKLVNEGEDDHFHNGLFVEMSRRDLFPLHVEFDQQEVEFTDAS